MKLYTEEKLRNSMLSMKTYIEMYDENVIDKIVENHIKALGCVELPSDDEIEENVTCLNLGLRYDFSMNSGFRKGAKWMRDKIQGGNK